MHIPFFNKTFPIQGLHNHDHGSN